MATPKMRKGAFTLIELLVVVAIMALLAGLLLPALARGREMARASVCLSNQRQIGLATRMYLDDHRGELFHHHEGWVLDDGSQVETLPRQLSEVAGGGIGHSEAEKPWVIFFQPYLSSREVGFCPSDRTRRSTRLATTLAAYNGGITDVTQEPPAESELAIAEREYRTIVSYLLNSVLSHKSARYALEGVLRGFLTDTQAARLRSGEIVVFSERNSEAMNAPDNEAYGSVGQDDYDTWVGEAALVHWGPEAGPYGSEGWIRYDRHNGAANYVYLDGHAARQRWRAARAQQFPDQVVRRPLDDPPQ